MAAKKKTPPKTQKKKALKAKKKKLSARKQNLKKIETRLQRVDKELALIEKELRRGGGDSKVVEADLRKLESRLMHLDLEETQPKKTDEHKKFYRKFVFKCKGCKGQFDKNINVAPIKKKLVCPACGKDHTLGLTPSSRFYHVSNSKHIEIKK